MATWAQTLMRVKTQHSGHTHIANTEQLHHQNNFRLFSHYSQQFKFPTPTIPVPVPVPGTHTHRDPPRDTSCCEKA